MAKKRQTEPSAQSEADETEEAPTKQIPLRLRRRADGTIALTDRNGAIDGETREFPETFVFGYEWLTTQGAQVASFSGQGLSELTLALCNAEATYEVLEQTPTGVVCQLQSGEVWESPALDQDAVQLLQEQREERDREAALVDARRLLGEAGEI